MTAVTTAKLLELIGKSSATPPPGFHAVPADRLILPIFEATPQQAPRIDYTAFYNPSTNELIISGQAKPFVQLKPGVNPEDGKDLGIFADATVRESVPVSQTVQLAQQLAHPVRGEYKNATVTFVGEGAAGLAFSATSHALRNDPNAQVSVGATVTLNAWRSTWTPDGSTDTGVLDIRTPNPANGDPTWINDSGLHLECRRVDATLRAARSRTAHHRDRRRCRSRRGSGRRRGRGPWRWRVDVQPGGLGGREAGP